MVTSEKTRLVVFDVEGVLVPKNRFIFEVGKKLGLARLVKLLFFGFLYEAGIMRLDSVLKRLFNELEGVRVDVLKEVFEKISPITYLKGVFSQIKARGCKIALISSGLPTMLVKELSDALGAEYAYGVEVEIIDGKLTGKIWGDAIQPEGKLKIVEQILTAENLGLRDCVVVADDRNNRCMFLPGMLKIGFNPDFVIRVKADKVVNGKLSAVIPILDGKPRNRSFPSTNDFVREDIHASGVFMPVIAGLIGVPAVGTLILLIAAVYTVSELWRLEGKELRIVSAVTRHAASQSELYGFAAAPLYFAGGILFTLIVFPHPASYAAIAMFCLGDSAASLFGGLVSDSLPFNKGKTWEGSLAGFFFAFLAGMFFLPTHPLVALAGAAIAMTVEVLPLPINDNVLIPVITGAALSLLV
ncbi:MAG: HAD-IB family phosphatase [Candidatus Bathyarchaeia archaeon]|jgi:HAD superfamily phosphoserine phosphatase-like hydrolase